MSDDLKPLPCPFCGVGVRAMSRYHPRDPNEWYVSCGARDCVMQPETPTYRTEAEAIAAWNRRASSPPERKEALAAARRMLEPIEPDGSYAVDGFFKDAALVASAMLAASKETER